MKRKLILALLFVLTLLAGASAFQSSSPPAHDEQVATTSPTYAMKFTPLDPSVDWMQTFAEFENSGSPKKNQVSYAGWNLAPGGGLQVYGLPANGFSFENNYHPANDPNAPYSESHLFHVTAQGLQLRPWSFMVSHVTGDGIGSVSIGKFQNRDVTGQFLFSEISASRFTVYVPTTLASLKIQNPADFSLQMMNIKPAVTGGTDPILILGQNDTEYPSVEVGRFAPSVTRRGGSLYLQTSSSIKDGKGSPLWAYDQYLGWQRVALGGNFLDDITVMGAKQVLFSSGDWYGARDVGIARAAPGKIRITSSAGLGAIEAGTLYLNDGTIKQVTYGPHDSGGRGFKILRIAN